MVGVLVEELQDFKKRWAAISTTGERFLPRIMRDYPTSACCYASADFRLDIEALAFLGLFIGTDTAIYDAKYFVLGDSHKSGS
ncbi:MAG: hypothetical protein WDM89_19410 [Rhizomicrobium sp.]